jgi:hypothetical protein
MAKKVPILLAYFSNPKEEQYLAKNAILDTGATISDVPKSLVRFTSCSDFSIQHR